MSIKHLAREARLASAGTPIRTVIFRNVDGVRYTLRVWDTGRLDSRGCSYLAYHLYQGFGRSTWVLFEGDDFAGSPLHSDDADETMRALLVFLCLRPGDTDAEHFASYSAEQLAWAISGAEALAQASHHRFGEG